MKHCIDYCKLNQIIQKNNYPLPNVPDCLDTLDRTKFFFVIHGLLLRPFLSQTHRGSQGQDFILWIRRRLLEIHSHVLWILQCPCDICETDRKSLGTATMADMPLSIFSKTVAQHLDHLWTVFQCLREAKLELKPKELPLTRKRYRGLQIAQLLEMCMKSGVH